MAHIKYGNMGKTIPNMDENGGSGSSLPAVTSADEGKVLQVNSSGQWGAGNRIVKVELSYIEVSGSDVGVLNYTWAELKSLFFDGNIIFYCASDDVYNYATFAILTGLAELSSNQYIAVFLTTIGNNNTNVISFSCSSPSDYPQMD